MNVLTPEEKEVCASSLFSNLLNKGGDAVFIVQRDASVIYVNAQAEALLGFSANELATISYLDLLVKDSEPEALDRFHSFFIEEKGFDRYVGEMKANNHRVLSVEISAFSVLLRGAPAQVLIVHDVHEHKKMETVLQKNIERYKELASIVEQSFEAIMITDLEGIIRYVNASWEQLNGWSSTEVVGKVTPRVIKSGVQSVEFYEEFWKMLLAGSTVERTVTNKRKDETLYEAEIIAIPLTNDQGAITGFAGFQHDITAKNEIRAQLMREKKFSDDIIERVGAIVIVIDPQGQITRFNKEAEHVTGYAKDEVIGKSVFETIFPREKYPLLFAEFKFSKNEKGLTKSFENFITTKSGDERFIEWVVGEIIEGGQTIAIITFGSDITSRNKMESEILEKNKDLERFRDLMVGRELKMIELKKEIDVLKKSTIVHAEKSIN